MEQNPSHVDAYLLGKSFSEDYDQAHAINHHYDYLRDEIGLDASSSLLLESAILRAHATLGERSSIPGADEFGYETSAYAWRWFNFRGAYLKDLQPVYRELDDTQNPHQHGLSLEFESYAKKMEFLQNQQAEAAEQLLRKNSMVFETFADLEFERIRCQTDPNAMAMLDLFATEEQFALRTLCRVLDRATNQPEALRIDNTIRFTIRPENEKIRNVIEITREKYRNGRVEYVLEEFEATPGGTSEDEELLPLARYRIDCRPYGIKFFTKGFGDDMLRDTFDLLDLAHELHQTTRS